MMGALAIVEGSIGLDDYLVDMTGRGQTKLRVGQTEKALELLAESKALTRIEAGKLPQKNSGKRRKSKSTRL